MPFSRGYYWPRDWTQVSHIAGRFFTSWATKETQVLLRVQLSLVQTLGHVWLFVTSWTAACQASLSFTKSQSLLKLMSIESVMPSIHLLLCHPFLLLHQPFSHQGLFFNDSILHIRWSKYWSFSLSISLSNEYSGLISFIFFLILFYF